MFRRLILGCICLGALPVLAQVSSLSLECQEAVRAGESIRHPNVYAACGFDDKAKALYEWAPWAEKEKAGQALFEICVRHKGAESYCQKAQQLGNGPALLRSANQSYAQKDFTGAAELYKKALTSPLLDDFEKGDIAQKMGLLYMNPESRYYNPGKGLPLIERASERRGAEANNLMGVYALFGLEGVPQNAKESFKYLWRSVLLGCPAAEENLGLWHLAKQKKIDNKTVQAEMAKRMFSCIPPEDVAPEEIQKNTCDCQEVMTREQMANRHPYRLIGVADDARTVTLLDKTKQEIEAKLGTQLPNGMKINEINAKSVVLTSAQGRIRLNLAPVDNCPELCQKQRTLTQTRAKKIKPYHLTFTPQECSDILFYAEQLVDTTLPFTGKVECAFSAEMDKTADLLMNL